MKRKVFWLSAILVVYITIFFTAGCFAEAVEETAPRTEIKQACLSATVTAIELEIDRYKKWIDLRKQQGDTQALSELEKSMALLQADLERYSTMAVTDYVLPEKAVCTAWVENKLGVNSLLYIERMSKSGPFYHLAGITGGDYSLLQPGTRYNMTLYKIYPRSYWNMESHYVYISSADNAALSAATKGLEQRNEDMEYLSEDKDMRFYRLKNIYAGSADQQWIRIELGNRAQAELQSLRPADIVDTDRLAKITTVLCRVKIDPIAGKYAVTEQLWLDEEDQVIGDSSAWEPQGWPEPYIREACESFLSAWFSFDTGQQPVYIQKAWLE